jgi:hypothetical protein
MLTTADSEHRPPIGEGSGDASNTFQPRNGDPAINMVMKIS